VIEPPPREHRVRSALLVFALLSSWATAIVGGFAVLWRYESTPSTAAVREHAFYGGWSVAYPVARPDPAR